MYVASLGVGFGAYALHLGYDSIIVGSIFGFLGSVIGYIAGRKIDEETET